MLVVPAVARYSYCTNCVGLSSVGLVTPVLSHESLHMTRPALNLALLKFPSFTPTYMHTRSNICVIDTSFQALCYLASTGDIPLRSCSVWLNLVNLHTVTYPPPHTHQTWGMYSSNTLLESLFTQYTTHKKTSFSSYVLYIYTVWCCMVLYGVVWCCIWRVLRLSIVAQDKTDRNVLWPDNVTAVFKAHQPCCPR